MSSGTAPSSSTGSGNNSHSSNEIIDHSAYTYDLPQDVLNSVSYYLDQNNAWEEAARRMGYTPNDIIKIKKMVQNKHITPAEQLISLWGDQNHTVTELFMVLFRLRQFSAMECLKGYVHKNYHRLFLYGLPEIQILQQKMAETSRKNNQYSSDKILNGPELSRDCNESDYTVDSMQASSNSVINRNKIEQVASTMPRIPYEELRIATDNWNEERVLGRGGFGSVYKGRWSHTEVAIKKIVYKSNDSEKNFKVQMMQSSTELRFLNSCRHDNILPLYGFSNDGPEPCLVYQYMSGGSLHVRLYGKLGPLTFNQRKKIALGTARGLQYLHTYNKGKPLIHGDIKPANILLDAGCVPKIGDFGLVREGSDEMMEVSAIYGTRPYLPREFLANKTLSIKIDTYSYGVVLFELFTAKKAYDKRREIEYAPLAKHMQHTYEAKEPLISQIDKSLSLEQVDGDLFEKLMKVAIICTNENADKRPEMVEVLRILDELIKLDELESI